MQPFRASLQAKVLAVVLTSVGVPLLVMGGYLLRWNGEILREKVRDALSNHLFRRASEIDEWMRQRVNEISRWSASFVVFEGVEAILRRGPEAVGAQRDLKSYLDSVRGHFGVYESFFVTDPRGNVLASTREERLEDWGKALLGKQGSTPVGLVSPLRRSEQLGRPTLLVMHAVQGRRDQTVGYFVGRLALEELKAHLRSPPEEPAPTLWLLDDQGRVLGKAGNIPDSPGEEAFPAPLAAGSGAEAVREQSLPRMGPTVYGIRRLQGPSGGYVAATVAAPTVYRALAESRSRLLRIGLPAVAIVFLLSFLLARSVLRPIRLLSEGARRLTAGELDVSLPVRGADEIADLTRAFNVMAGKIRETNRALETLAITDELTGLYNRRHFQDTLDRELRRAKREDRPLSLLFLDLDHFKQYNDRWGHSEGDAALRRVSDAVVESVRASDMAFRYGGEELAVLLYSCAKDQAVEVAEKVRRAVEAASPAEDAGKRITVSIGVATFPEDGEAIRELVDRADSALYAAKAEGRDRVARAGAPAPAQKKAGRRKA
ncbi:MAG TPA: diguanylate cyclase [Thermoanaerobaculia bacterium]|nr:diguanylate cyclase [Thermoanaerobaculia bacterium]